MVTIKYALSTTGQKASLLAGGSGERVQSVVVRHGEPEYAVAVGLAAVDIAGKAALDLHASQPQGASGTYSVREYDTPPTVADLLTHERERQAFVAERKAAAERETMAELLADVPASLIEKSFNYGWRVKEAAEKRVQVIGAEAIDRARAEADRRNAEDKAEAERSRAEHEAKVEAEKRAKAKREAAELAALEAWAEKHGSDRLKRCVDEGIECRRIYRDERLALEYPGWQFDGSHLPNWEKPRNPPAEALALLDQARKSLPPDWTDDDRASVELKFWSAKVEDDDGEEDRLSGYVAVAEILLWTDCNIVYGYDGPEDDD